jgi:hypothetical protein
LKDSVILRGIAVLGMDQGKSWTVLRHCLNIGVCVQNNIRAIKSRRMTWLGHVGSMGSKKNAKIRLF